MSVRVELPEDDWIEFIDPDDLTSKQHRKVMQAIATGATSGLVSVTLAIRDTIIMQCVQAWSFRDRVPRDAAQIEKLEIPMLRYRRMLDAVDDYAKPFRLNLGDDEDPTRRPSID